MGQNYGSYPPLSRHPELQQIREAQNNLLVNPQFMQQLMGNMGFGTAQQAQGGPAQSYNFGSPGETHFRKMNPGEDMLGYSQQRMQFLRGQMGRSPQQRATQPQNGGK